MLNNPQLTLTLIYPLHPTPSPSPSHPHPHPLLTFTSSFQLKDVVEFYHSICIQKLLLCSSWTPSSFIFDLRSWHKHTCIQTYLFSYETPYSRLNRKRQKTNILAGNLSCRTNSDTKRSIVVLTLLTWIYLYYWRDISITMYKNEIL